MRHTYTAEELKALVNAQDNGKPVEMNSLGNPIYSGWIPKNHTDWWFDTMRYRLAPDPFETWWKTQNDCHCSVKSRMRDCWNAAIASVEKK